MISCEIGTEHDLISQLKKIDEIKNVMITYGDYDIVIEAITESTQKMDECRQTLQNENIRLCSVL